MNNILKRAAELLRNPDGADPIEQGEVAAELEAMAEQEPVACRVCTALQEPKP